MAPRGTPLTDEQKALLDKFENDKHSMSNDEYWAAREARAQETYNETGFSGDHAN